MSEQFPQIISIFFRLLVSISHAGIIIGLLIVIVATCFTTSYGFQALQRNFNSNCVSSASIVFKPPAIRNNAIGQNNNGSNSSEENAKKVNGLLKEFNSFYRSEANNETDEITSAHLYEYLNNGPTIFRTTTERSNLTVEEKDLLNSKDADFFKNCKLRVRCEQRLVLI